MSKGQVLARIWRKGNLHALLVGMQIGAVCRKHYGVTSKKLKMELPYDPVIPLLGIIQRNLKYLFKRIMHPIFIAALFIITKIWKQPKSLSVDEWIKKLWNTAWLFKKKRRRRRKENSTLCYSIDRLGEHYDK